MNRLQQRKITKSFDEIGVVLWTIVFILAHATGIEWLAMTGIVVALLYVVSVLLTEILVYLEEKEKRR